MRNYTKKGTYAENFKQISLLLTKIWYLKDSRNGHFAMHYSSFSALYTPSPGFKAILSKCLFLYVFIVTLAFDPYFLIMDNIWTKLITGLYVFHEVVSIFVHCDLDLSSLTLKINRDHRLTMDNKYSCTKFDQTELNSFISIVFNR